MKYIREVINRENGISLIALVVTIIILLILAVITITQLTGNRLFEKVTQAKEKSENAQIEEEGKLADYENKIDEYIDASGRDSSKSYDILWDWETVDENGNIQQNVANGSINSTITLNNNIENYKFLIVFSRGYQPGQPTKWYAQVSSIVPAKVTESEWPFANTYYQYTNAGYNINYGFTNSTTLKILSSQTSWFTNCSITQVWGMK